ncbi:hypothetical protein TNCV_3177941 [Trichonephila clavipes]|nr:hypothetical protein TNCV_3177941 [Trichonephila clavipes]
MVWEKRKSRIYRKIIDCVRRGHNTRDGIPPDSGTVLKSTRGTPLTTPLRNLRYSLQPGEFTTVNREHLPAVGKKS